MQPIVLVPAVVALAALSGYWYSGCVRGELSIGKPWFLVLAGLLGAASLAVLPWWQATLITGLAVLGWLPGMLAVGWLGSSSTVVAAQLAVFLAFVIGTRWRAENYRLPALIIAAALITLAGSLLV